MKMIPDEDFIKNPDIPGPTKEEIRCLVMCKSQVSSEDTVVDIGCGTGGLTAEFARRAKKVYAVDKNPEALEITRQNLEKHKLEDKVHLIEGSAPAVLGKLPDFNILMIGGSSGELSSIINEGYKKLVDNGRITITSILMETRVEAVNSIKELGLVPEVIEASISKGRIMDRGTLMEARNSVTVISAKKERYVV